MILGILNAFIIIIPLAMAYILNDIIRIYSNNGQIQTKVLFVTAVAFVIISTLLKQSQFLILQTNGKRNVSSTTKLIKNMCSLVSIGSFALIILYAIIELYTNAHNMGMIPQMILLTSFICIFLGIFAGFTQNIISESGEELDSYDSREDFQSVVKDYQQWVNLFVNNFTKKKLKDINNKIFNL